MEHITDGWKASWLPGEGWLAEGEEYLQDKALAVQVAATGQVLVTDDMLGMFERVPRFVKQYEKLAETITGAAVDYAREVRDRSFPGVDQTYQPK